jgi:uncharacterized membrane protein YbhN (UPF0104 family)
VSLVPVSRPRSSRAARRGATALIGVALVAGMLIALASHRHAFVRAVAGVPVATLLLAAGLHAGSVVARSEAWAVSVAAAGGTLRRRAAYQVASLSFAANVLSPSLGTALRVWALRTIASDQAPPAPTLVAAEVPIFAVQLVGTAAMSISLVGPLGAPWWTAPAVLIGACALFLALCRFARRSNGPWRGLAALRAGATCARIGGLIAAIAACETARNLLVLHAVGLHAGPLDAMALIVGAGVLGILPIGPGTSAGAAMLIFGAGGVGPAAAAGVLLTATGFTADLAYAAWGAGDMLWRACPVRRQRLSRAADIGAAVCCTGVALAAIALT